MFFNQLIQAFIDTFSSNKYNSRNPETRKRAIQKLPVSDQDALTKIAINDSDESIRCIAINKLNDLDTLQTILIKSSSDNITKTSQIRLFQLLCGMKQPIPDYKVREQIIHGSRQPALLEFAAANADQAALREIAIKKITRDALLGDIALSDESPTARQLAAQQISKRSTLERVVKNARRKDKRVYKIVKAKLDLIIEDEERPQLFAKEVIDICDKLEKLHKRQRLQQERTTFDNYVKRWEEISNFSNSKTTQRFNKIKTEIDNSYNDLDNNSNKQHEIVISLKNILNNLSIAVDEVLVEQANSPLNPVSISKKESHGEKENNILQLGKKWDETIHLLNDQILIDDYNNQFFSILELSQSHTADDAAVSGRDDIDQHKVEHDVHAQREIDKINNLISQAEVIADSSNIILKTTVSTLNKKFAQYIENTSIADEEIEKFKQSFSSFYQIINDKLQIQQNNTEKLTQQISNQIEQIQAMINQGLTSKATPLFLSLTKKINKTAYLSNEEKNNYHNEIKHFQLELGELSSWKSWAHDNERENLLLKAENLFKQYLESNNIASEYKDITAQIKELRQQWKKMRSHTADELWQKFNNACNSTYELCIPFLEQEEEIRQQNLIQKQHLCAQLENYINNMSWSLIDKELPENNSAENNGLDSEATSTANSTPNMNTDWTQVDKITKQARKEWSSIGFVDKKEHKKINQRFQQAIQIIRDEIDKGRQINQQQFEMLISKMEALHETIESDLANAINKAKKYQQQWKLIGPVSSYQRNKLWKRFRAACDVIFAKRQVNIDEKNSHIDELIREKEAICENLEALNLQPLNKKDLEVAFSDIRKLWSELQSQAKTLAKELNQRYTLAEKAYFKKLDELIIKEQANKLELIKAKAAICTQVEVQATLNDTISDDKYTQFEDKINQQWQHLESLPNTMESKLLARLNQAFKALQSQSESQSQAIAIEQLQHTELKFKQDFCLQHEIRLGKESPAAEEQHRMQMQIELLNKKMGQNQMISQFEMQFQWYQFSNYTQDGMLEVRFSNLLVRDS